MEDGCTVAPPVHPPAASRAPTAAHSTVSAALNSPYGLTVPEISIARTLVLLHRDPEFLFLTI
jgi:hypothetical protein